MDLLEVIANRLRENGITDVFTTTPDGSKHPESVTLAFGVPDRTIVDFAGNRSAPIRVTVIVLRISEYDAMTVAQDAERIIRTSPLDSENGSYEIERVDTSEPAPLPWDESGRFVWAFEVSIELRKDFF